MTLATAATDRTPSNLINPRTLGFVRMPAASAKSFLADLRNGCSPIVATGDDCGTVKIE
jgi:hypothetical protein